MKGFMFCRHPELVSGSSKTGFTLIELLVVVLIIGILSAVALPQYTKAVEKSRAASAWTILNGMRTAAETYSLANSSFTSLLASSDPWQDLDLSFPLEKTEINGYLLLKDKNFYYHLDLPEQVRAYRGNASGGFPGDYDLTIKVQPSSPFSAGDRTCAARTTNGHTICKTMGGKLRSGSSTDYIL